MVFTMEFDSKSLRSDDEIVVRSVKRNRLAVTFCD